jgi:hypothetical protein
VVFSFIIIFVPHFVIILLRTGAAGARRLSKHPSKAKKTPGNCETTEPHRNNPMNRPGISGERFV